MQVMGFDWGEKEGSVRFPFKVSKDLSSITKAPRESRIGNQHDQLLVAALIKAFELKDNIWVTLTST